VCSNYQRSLTVTATTMTTNPDGFQITLISNSDRSLELYPDNTVAKFRTKLFNEITLHGPHEIAITEFQCPVSFRNIDSNEYDVCMLDTTINTIPRDRNAKTATVTIRDNDTNPEDMQIQSVTSQRAQGWAIVRTIPPGYYASAKEVANVINDMDICQKKLAMFYDSLSRRVGVSMNAKGMQFFFSPKLYKMLGYKPDTPYVTANSAAPYPPSMFHTIPTQLFVYCDLVEPQLVGDSKSSLLRVVGMDYELDSLNNGKLFTKIYDTPDYLPLLKNSFDTIGIDIRTYEDRPVPFHSGPSMVKVRIRPVLSRGR
jgi:hypothetical protein